MMQERWSGNLCPHLLFSSKAFCAFIWLTRNLFSLDFYARKAEGLADWQTSIYHRISLLFIRNIWYQMNHVITIKLTTIMGVVWKTGRRMRTAAWKYSLALNRSFDGLSDWINTMLGIKRPRALLYPSICFSDPCLWNDFISVSVL